MLIYALVHFKLGDNLHEIDAWYIAIDILITLFMVFELTIRIIASQKTFWHSKLNVLDCIVVIICVLGLLLYLASPGGDYWNSDNFFKVYCSNNTVGAGLQADETSSRHYTQCRSRN